MGYGNYDDLLDSVRGLQLSQSVLENTVRALDGDYAIYFDSLDKSISSLKSALNRSRDESEDLVQVVACPLTIYSSSRSFPFFFFLVLVILA